MASAKIDIPFVLSTEDGKQFNGNVRLADMARTEMKTGTSLASFERETPSFAFLLTAAYFALRRIGQAPDNFDLWFDSVVDFEPGDIDEGEAEAPSEKAALSTKSRA